MRLSDFDFPFDPSLVAAQPAVPRDQARLLVLDRQSGQLTHHRISDLPSLLAPGDVVVVNNTKVLPARMMGTKRPSGRPVEMLFVKDLGDNVWQVMVRGKFRARQVIEFAQGVRATILQRDAEGTVVKVESPIPVRHLLQQYGMMPLPPYLKRRPLRQDHEWYQTVFATHEGAVAAPTAGLHFTNDLLARLAARAIDIVAITLHVGPGTFRPVVTEHIEDHRMDGEVFKVEAEAAQAILRAKQRGRRVVAVGTTVVRTLETVAMEHGRIIPAEGESHLFITPGFRFLAVDALMTNFHLPRTTLLMLVSAFAGIESVRRAYEEAVQKRYRFYSYGDAMLIL
ncbi:MAG: tRNA preQ1(34) S-adenosylmethionine ribosyltransferase-isomerase QueA [Nitrospira sp.]|nr:tRNA preQ1(34) S-adenosylmethionine ribosyltransferase-isomerase QueA [Nitrospira sp.]